MSVSGQRFESVTEYLSSPSSSSSTTGADGKAAVAVLSAVLTGAPGEVVNLAVLDCADGRCSSTGDGALPLPLPRPIDVTCKISGASGRAHLLCRQGACTCSATG
eukprot:COSAG01_NODE_22554_length_850_cov_3.761651_2_plen_105_part_00